MDGSTLFFSIFLPCEEHVIVLSNSLTRFFIKISNNISNRPFKKTSPFLIGKTFRSFIEVISSLKKLNSCDFLVEVSSVNQSQLLSHISAIDSSFVSAHVHTTLNMIQGVIFFARHVHSTKREVLKNAKDESVVYVCRIV